jgi:hypothetical protein
MRSMAKRDVTLGVSRDWGDQDGIDITDLPLAGLGTVNGAGFAQDRPLCFWFPAVVGHCRNGVIPPISGQSREQSVLVRSLLATRPPGALRHYRAVPARHRALLPARALASRPTWTGASDRDSDSADAAGRLITNVSDGTGSLANGRLIVAHDCAVHGSMNTGRASRVTSIPASCNESIRVRVSSRR